jgi:hypothetical protein
MQVTALSLTTVKAVPGVAPKFTAVAAENPQPLTVTAVPPV